MNRLSQRAEVAAPADLPSACMPAALVDAALALLTDVAGARLALAIDPDGEVHLRRCAGSPAPDPRDLLREVELGADAQWRAATVPAAWRSAGVVDLAVYRTPGESGWLAVGWADPPTEAGVGWVRTALALTGERRTRLRLERRLRDLTDRFGPGEEPGSALGDDRQTGGNLDRLLDSSPAAILILDAWRRIVRANSAARELLGGDPVGRAATELSPWFGTDGHGVEARALDGRPLVLDVAVDALDADGSRAVYLRVADPRHAHELRAAALRAAEDRRGRAQDVNDDVVQGLTAAILALQQDKPQAATRFLEQTLTAARQLMADWVTDSDGSGIRPGALVRNLASVLPAHPSASPELGGGSASVAFPRVLVVDDSEDVRVLLCAQLEDSGKATVVGQAASGREAVRLAAALQPDLVFLDLSMPEMDGLQALPQILAAVPGVKVVVMSGFDERSVAEQVLAGGAARYLEKGLRMNLAAIIDEVYQAA
ncbi:MAG: response regulator [Sporichthyaceae bacterium]